MRKTAPRTDPPRWSGRLYIRVPRMEIAYFKFVLESYDNLAFMSVLDRFEALLCLTYSPDQEAELVDLIHRLAREIDIWKIPVPISDTRSAASK